MNEWYCILTGAGSSLAIWFLIKAIILHIEEIGTDEDKEILDKINDGIGNTKHLSILKEYENILVEYINSNRKVVKEQAFFIAGRINELKKGLSDGN